VWCISAFLQQRVLLLKNKKKLILIYFLSYNGQTNCENVSVMTARRNCKIMYKQNNIYTSCMIFGKEEGYGLRNVIGRKETLAVFKYTSANNFQIF